MSRKAEESSGRRAVLVLLAVPLVLAAVLAMVWLLPAGVVALSTPVDSPTDDADASGYYRGDRVGPATQSAEQNESGDASGYYRGDRVGPAAQSAEQNDGEESPEIPLALSAAEAAGQSLPEESSTDSEGTSKSLRQVLDGSTVLRRGDSGLPVRFVQQRLNIAGIEVPESGEYDETTEQAITRAQEKYLLNQTGRVNRYTLDTLLRVTARGPVLPEECNSGTVLCIDKTQKVVRLVVDGQTTMTLDARFGAFGAATDEGRFPIYAKVANDFSTQFGVPMQYSMYFSGGQAVHYSDYFADEGYSGASAGCVNTRDLEAVSYTHLRAHET